MTQEDKELLLKDLCARLSYGVKVKTPYNDAILRGIVDRKGVKTTIDYTDIITDKQTYPIRYIQPYLRTMSSMTEEEKKEWEKGFELELIALENEAGFNPVSCASSVFEIDFYNKYHFDYRGLIEKGLAMEVTKENNPYEN